MRRQWGRGGARASHTARLGKRFPEHAAFGILVGLLLEATRRARRIVHHHRVL